MWLRVIGVLSLALVLTATGCESRSDEQPNAKKIQNAPAGPADLCALIGTDFLRLYVPSPEPKADLTDFELWNEASCSVYSSLDAVSPVNANLWVGLNRHGKDASGRTPDEICRQDLEGHKAQDGEEWADPNGKDLGLKLGDITESRVRPIQDDHEALIVLCRSADFVELNYRTSAGETAASRGAEEIARRVLDVVKR